MSSKAARALALGGFVAAAGALLDLTGTGLGRALAPVLTLLVGSAEGWAARLGLSLILAIALAGNLAILARLAFRTQVAVIWGELLMLGLLFFDRFDLSYGFIARHVGYLIAVGATTTLYVSLASIAAACPIALLAALGRLSKNPAAVALSSFYISFFRGTPLLLQVYLIYLGLPQLGLVLAAVPSGIIALALGYGAYMAEIFRAGIEGVPLGQREAARALGLKESALMRKIVLPQALKLVVPPVGNQFISMLKDSSLVSVMGVWELMFLARTQGRSEFRHLEMLITAAVIYWLLSIGFELIQARIEAYYGKPERRR